MALRFEPEALSLLYSKVMGFFSLRGLLPLVPATKFSLFGHAIARDLTAFGSTLSARSVFDDSAYHTSPGKFLLTVSDFQWFQLVPILDLTYCCKSIYEGLISQRVVLQLRQFYCFSAVKTRLREFNDSSVIPESLKPIKQFLLGEMAVTVLAWHI